MKDDALYIIHILECIDHIQEYVFGGRDAFMNTDMVRDAVLRNLQVIGQSAKNISEKVKEAHPEIDWRGMIAFRNALVHDYLGIDLEQVWVIVERDLPDLQRKIKAIQASLP